MKPILCFEQDCLHIDDSGATLTEAYCRERFAYWVEEEEQDPNEISFIPEYEDDFLIVYQVLNCEGESWKLMQSK